MTSKLIANKVIMGCVMRVMEQLVQGSAARVRLSFLEGLASEQSPPMGAAAGGGRGQDPTAIRGREQGVGKQKERGACAWPPRCRLPCVL